MTHSHTDRDTTNLDVIIQRTRSTFPGRHEEWYVRAARITSQLQRVTNILSRQTHLYVYRHRERRLDETGDVSDLHGNHY